MMCIVGWAAAAFACSVMARPASVEAKLDEPRHAVRQRVAQADRASAPPRAPDDGVACEGAASYWAGSGPRVLVLRRGTMSQQSPLRPTPDEMPDIVLQVTINGKAATAYGASFDSMRQGGAPQALEEQSGNPIAWAPSTAGLPKVIVVASATGTEVVARLQFQSCVAKSQQSSGRKGPVKGKARPTPAQEPAAGKPPPVRLPQGVFQ